MNPTDGNAEVPAAAPARVAAKRYFIKWGLISLAVLVALVIAESVLVELSDQPRGDGGRAFASFAEFMAHQHLLGYDLLGRFHDQWPAQIREERTQMNGMSFQLSDGTRHVYDKLDGYEVKLTRLVTPSGTEGVVVLRSKSRKAY